MDRLSRRRARVNRGLISPAAAEPMRASICLLSAAVWTSIWSANRLELRRRRVAAFAGTAQRYLPAGSRWSASSARAMSSAERQAGGQSRGPETFSPGDSGACNLRWRAALNRARGGTSHAPEFGIHNRDYRGGFPGGVGALWGGHEWRSTGRGRRRGVVNCICPLWAGLVVYNRYNAKTESHCPWPQPRVRFKRHEWTNTRASATRDFSC